MHFFQQTYDPKIIATEEKEIELLEQLSGLRKDSFWKNVFEKKNLIIENFV